MWLAALHHIEYVRLWMQIFDAFCIADGKFSLNSWIDNNFRWFRMNASHSVTSTNIHRYISNGNQLIQYRQYCMWILTWNFSKSNLIYLCVYMYLCARWSELNWALSQFINAVRLPCFTRNYVLTFSHLRSIFAVTQIGDFFWLLLLSLVNYFDVNDGVCRLGWLQMANATDQKWR